MTDEEKIAKGWVYSCVTGELVNPYERMPMVMQMLDKIGNHEIVGGHYVASIDPASDTPDVKVTRVYVGNPPYTEGHMSTGIGYGALDHMNKTGECGIALGYEALRHTPTGEIRNMNDPRVIEALNKKSDKDYPKPENTIIQQLMKDGYEIITPKNCVDIGEPTDFLAKGSLGGCNNVLFGLEAGLHFTTESNKVIIGDYIRNMDKSQPNVLFIGENVAIGKTLFGKPINLFDVITEYYNATRNQESL